MEYHLIDRFRKWLSFDRLGTMHSHYESVRAELSPRNAKEAQEAEFFTHEYDIYYRKAARLGKVRIVLYAFVYAAVLVNIIKLIPFLQLLVAFIELGSTLVGGGIAVALIFLLSARINLHMQRMEACMSHLVALYHLNPKRDTKRALGRMSKVI